MAIQKITTPEKTEGVSEEVLMDLLIVAAESDPFVVAAAKTRLAAEKAKREEE